MKPNCHQIFIKTANVLKLSRQMPSFIVVESALFAVVASDQCFVHDWHMCQCVAWGQLPNWPRLEFVKDCFDQQRHTYTHSQYKALNELAVAY